MRDTTDALPLSLTNCMTLLRKRDISCLWSQIVLAPVLLLSIFMNFFQLGQNGYGNLYYAAAVKSMGNSWYNFFFASFDPGGFVTVDKPPLAFWLQTLSTKIFSFTPFAIFFPQALCGVLAVWLLYCLVRRHFGVVAGFVAALALAVSPISVVTDRNNTIDGTLVLVLLLAAWAVIHTCETGKLRWLLLSSVFVGFGFNMKMAEAYLVVPALGMTYLLCAPHKIRTRIWHLFLAVLVMLAVSLSWLVAVDLTPASQRPYIGSTKNNSEISLALGYNGLNRLRIAGTSDPFRLFSMTFGGQIAWLLPFALLGIVALACQRRFNFQKDRQQLGLILWGFWLLTMAAFFTLDSSPREYYMTEMAPGLCALVGSGLVVMWQQYCSRSWRGWLLPIALVVTAAEQISMLANYPSWSQWLSPLIGILTALVVIPLIFLHLRPQRNLSKSTFRVASAMVSVGMLALLVAPTVWASYSVIDNIESSFPIAGPGAQDSPGSGFTQTDPAFISYLKAHQGNTKFLVATPSADAAAGIILSTNQPVMALGGFSGNDPILTTSELQTLIKNGIVRFFLINPQRGQNSLFRWVSSHCSSVSTSDRQSSAGNSRTGLGGSQLYDCVSTRS